MKKWVAYTATAVAVVVAGFIGYKSCVESPLLRFDWHYAQVPLRHELLPSNNYTVETASGSDAIYIDDKGQKLYVSEDEDGYIKEIYADTLLSTASNMTVYGNIKLGSDEEDVIKFYGETEYDFGQGKMYVRRLSDTKDNNIYIGTMNGKVIHVEVDYE